MLLQKQHRFYLLTCMSIILLSMLACGLSDLSEPLLVARYWAVDWRPDGQQVAAIELDNLTVFTDTLQESRSTSLGASSIAWHPDGTLIAVGNGKSVVILEGATLVGLQLIRVPQNRAVAWSPDGELLAVSAGADIELWALSLQDNQTPSLHQVRVLTGHQDTIASVAWNSDSRRVASISQGGSIQVFDAQTGEVECVLFLPTKSEPFGSILSIDWKPSSNWVAVTESNSSKILIWDTAAEKVVKSLSGGQSHQVSVEWSPDGSYLAGVGRKGITIWEVDAGRILNTFAPEEAYFLDASWRADGQKIAVAGDIKNHPTIWIWDIVSGASTAETQP
ncbi:MAG TPA: hypothetical protein PKD09_13995 [Aggregatilinea sp.]|uniref:WD40 repeat domain-containing protein n=1 Tax=Aggregatilinea sp. TaxID=2806333 RepID=UPI002C52D882|nr:hypothetical protein [Aggregatilinea sp.]HML22757.1 hypothetical protein [Aggregatilinea sp.]